MELEAIPGGEVGGRLTDGGHWLADLKPVEVPATDLLPAPPVVLGLLEEVVRSGVDLRGAIKAGNAITVEFPAEVMKGLKDGTLRLMQTSTGLQATAVNASHETVANARVVGAGAAAGAAGAGLVGAVSWPVLLVASVGLAAAMAERRWLEASFGKLEAGLARIETRLRDDDLGTLEAANGLVELLRPDVVTGTVPPQLAQELAAHRAAVEGVYLSRRRFVRRFVSDLAAAQEAHEARRGESKGWVKQAVDHLGDDESGSADELIVFVQAMVVRARLASVTAAVLATEGDGLSALRLLGAIEAGTRDDYWPIQRPISALARHQPEPALAERLRDRIPLDWGVSERERAAALVAVLDDEMQSHVGDHLPERNADVAITIPTAAVLKLVS